MPARVVIINDRSTAMGGATSLAILAARLLVERGIPVTFVAGDRGEGREALEAMGVELVAVGSAPLLERGRLSALATGLYSPAAHRTLARVIAERDTRQTVYHVHTWSRLLSPSAFHALRAVAGRTVLHAHDHFLACPNGLNFDLRARVPCERRPLSGACLSTHCDKRSYAQKLWRAARQRLREALFDVETASTQVLMIHPGMRARLERAGLPGHLLHTLRNPAQAFTREPLRPERQRRIVMIARLEEEKGYEDAARAARAAGVPLAIIGEGPGRARLEAEFPEVELVGWKSREEIGRLLVDARAVVMPTRGPEPFGLVAAEAIASGLPLILNDQAALAGEVEAGGFGLVYRVMDPNGLADAFRRIAGDDALVAAMAARARAGGRSLASTPADWCDQLLQRYAAAIDRAAAPRGVLPLVREIAS